jgi:restriction system protein
MSIPDYQACLLPILQLLADRQDHHIRVVTRAVADKFNLSDAEREQRLPSGQQTVIANRVGWAKTYLKQAGLVMSPKRGMVRLTDQGAEVLQSPPASLDIEFLREFPSFVEFESRSSTPEVEAAIAIDSSTTPEESMEASYLELRERLADDLLERVKQCSPQFFERLAVELLVAMGYGGSISDAGQAIGRSGDGGIDGIIKEDKLGLDVVYIQAKRWEANVGRPQVQAFAGSMQGFRARKGVMITTSSFSRDAEDYVSRIETKIVLINGQSLAQMMIDHDIGVAPARSYTLKRLDSDYFDGEES